MKLLRSLKRQLFGYDFFISYSRADCSEYASSLATLIIEKGYSCYLDQWGSDPGKSLPGRLKNKIKASSALILLASEQALHSTAISEEIHLFLPTRRAIIPVSFGNIFSAEWFPKIEGIAISNELSEHVSGNTPSEEIVTRAINSFTYLKQTKRIRRAITFAMLFIGLSTLIGLSIFWKSVELQQEIALQTRAKNLLEDDLAKSKDTLINSRILIDSLGQTTEKQKDSINRSNEILKIKETEIDNSNTRLINARTLASKFEDLATYNRSVADETRANAEQMVAFIRGYVQQHEFASMDMNIINNDSVVSGIDKIYFDYDKWDVNKRSKKILQIVIAVLKKYPDKKLMIEGHMNRMWYGTTVAEEEKNPDTLTAPSIKLPYPDRYAEALSERMAASARRYLIDNGIDENRISAIGYGYYRLEVPLDEPIAKSDFLGDFARIRFVD